MNRLRLLDDEIAKQVEILQALKQRRNEIAPVSSLPVEVLDQIFILLAPCASQLAELRPLISITQVCRRWRSYALSSPRLWTTVVLDSRDWTQEILARSRTALLTVHCVELDPWQWDRSLANLPKVLHRHGHRLRALQATIPPEGVKLIQSWPKSTVRLESLAINFVQQTVLPDALVAHFPRLRTLSLLQSLFSWDPTAHYPHLTSLSLTAHNLRGESPHFFDAIRQMPQLQELEIFDSLPTPPTRDLSVAFPPIFLPNLRMLRLTDTMARIAYFMRHSSLTVLHNVALHVSAPDTVYTSDERARMFLDSLTRIGLELKPDPSGVPQKLILELETWAISLVRCFARIVPNDDSEGAGPSVNLSLWEGGLTSGIYAVQLFDSFLSLFQTIPKCLCVRVNGLWSPQVWHMIGRLPDLDTLVIDSGPGAKSLLGAGVFAAFFSSLRSLQIDCRRDSNGVSSSFDTTLALLTQMHDVGCTIPPVTLVQQEELTEEQLTSLQKVVRDVRVCENITL